MKDINSKTNLLRAFRLCATGNVHTSGQRCECGTAKAAKHPVAEPHDPADLMAMTHVTPGMARVTDPETSCKAAACVDTGRFEQAVVDVLRSNPDSSIQDVVELTGERYRSISPRFAPLRRKGLICVSGKKRAAQTGRTVQTWRAS